jgi:putative ABC transport system permease protein
MSGLLEDVRFAWRLLRKNPGFTAVAVLTLALGIGANTAIFSLIRGVLLKPLGYPEPGRLVFISSQFPGLGFEQFWISPPEFFELKERARSFSAVGAFRTGSVNLGAGTEPRRVRSAIVTSDLFTTLGVSPLLGRTFTPEETLPNAAPVVVLSHDTWQQAFAGNPAIVGQSIEVDGRKPTVVGVMPPGFDVHDGRLELFLPVNLDPAERTRRRGNHFLYLVGRLAPGVTLPQARAELETLLASWQDVARDQHTPSVKQHRLRYDDLLGQLVGDVRRALWVLQAAVIAVLLIACANLANLLLARSEARQREFAVRAALGAGRARLLRQFTIEGIVLALLGATAGTAAAWVALRGLSAVGLEALPRLGEIALDGTVLAFTLILAVATGLLFGLAPMLHFRDAALGVTLKEGGSRTSTARGRVRRLLVITEIATAVVLVVSATLLLRTFWNLMQVDAGFARERLVTFGVVLPNATYADPAQRTGFFARLLGRLEQAPGVESVAAMNGLPPRREVNANDTNFEGITYQPGMPPHNVDYYQIVTTRYLETMGIRIVEGRGFQPSDATSTNAVALVNEMMAKRFWPGQSPIGRRVRPSAGPDTPWMTIVGVVADVKQGGVAEPVGSELYFCFDQGPAVYQFAPGNMNVAIRTALPVEAIAALARREVGALDASLPIVDLRSMEAVFEETLSRPRLLARLLGAFAALALLLAVIGTYGVLAYTVAERRREIGVRMALGADRGRVLAMVLGDGMLLAGIGVALGVVGALVATRVLGSMLYGITPTDPVTLGSVLALMLGVALLACYLPARRASAVDPMLVLRDE